MLSAEQIKKIISENESLQVQLADANRMLAAREEEIAFLNTELDGTAALRSKLDGQLAEIASIQNKLEQKQDAVAGAEEREFELHQELTGMALLNKQYNELVQDYAFLQSQYKDIQMRYMDFQQRNLELEKATAVIGALQSRLENCLLESNALREKINILEAQKFIRKT